MARSELAIGALIGGSAIALLAACNAVLGLGDYSEVACVNNCDDAGAEASFDGGMDTGAVPDVAVDTAMDVEAGQYNAAFAWASWPMPNPVDDGGYPHPPSYDAGGDSGVVYDSVTQLVWENNGASAKSEGTVTAAQDDCARLPGGPWRLPTRIELVTLIDYTRDAGPMIDPVFTSTWPSSYWTSSPVAGGSTSTAWTLDFGSGDVRAGGSPAYVRCVRGGKARTP